MIVEVFELLPGGRELDPDRLVARVHLPLVGPGRVEVVNPQRAGIVQELFENDFSSFVGEGDVVKEHTAWSPEAIHQILQEELYAYSLAGRVTSKS